MKPKPKPKVSSLLNKAKENATVTKGKNPVKVLKDGKPLDRVVVHDPITKEELTTDFVQTVGCSVGVTLNMGDYESMRIDTWLTDKVKPKETEKKALARIYAIAKDCISEFSMDFKK